MVKLLCAGFFCFISLPLLAQHTNQENPPNTIRLDENLFIDKTEIVNLHWLEYLHYLSRDSGQVAMVRALPDTSVWLAYGDTLRWKHYLRHPGYRYFPVVGITLTQARDYCAWRSKVVSGRIADSVHVQYRLPSEAEWSKAAAANLKLEEFPYGYPEVYGPSTLVNRKAKQYYQKATKPVDLRKFRRDLKEYIRREREIVFNVIKSFQDYFQYGDYAPSYVFDQRTPPNSLGLHHMIGNVAEMTDQPGIAKGASWFHYPEEGMINKQIIYFKPEAWLGFRCVCEVDR